MLERWLDELPIRNRDNVSRTESYLELYAHTAANPPDLPWLLMAHLVSRNAGYWMSDLAARMERKPEQAEGLTNLFLLLERANFLIFHDAWYHVLQYLSGREPQAGRAPRFIREAWARHRADPSRERELVLDLVINEQNYIEHRVVHAPRFEVGLALIGFIEASGREKPISFPLTAAEIRVGGFAQLDKRILTGQRIFDEVLADRDHRRRLFEWAKERPHTGDRSVIGEAPSPPIRSAWTVERVTSLDAGIHAEPEPDPRWP
jgi:hypothetical protein